jgi:predicted aspartyl protease
VIGVVAPLISVGSYACLGLNFPNVVTKPGVEINFVLDTAANVNTISSELANELDLPVVVKGDDLSLLGSAGAGGSFQVGDIVMLGDSRLSGMPENQRNNTFMTNLTAAAMNIGIARSFGGGLLGTSFFNCFRGGVEFDWYGTDGDPPTLIFYYDMLPDNAKENATCVPINTEEFFGVPTVSVNINGKELQAIIDTGSLVTIISPIAASEIGISKKEGRIKVKGVDDGDAISISKSLDHVSISIGDIKMNLETIFIGELPGLAMAIGLTLPEFRRPQVLLGLDALRRTYRMILGLSNDELWLEGM